MIEDGGKEKTKRSVMIGLIKNIEHNIKLIVYKHGEEREREKLRVLLIIICRSEKRTINQLINTRCQTVETVAHLGLILVFVVEMVMTLAVFNFNL